MLENAIGQLPFVDHGHIQGTGVGELRRKGLLGVEGALWTHHDLGGQELGTAAGVMPVLWA